MCGVGCCRINTGSNPDSSGVFAIPREISEPGSISFVINNKIIADFSITEGSLMEADITLYFSALDLHSNCTFNN